MGEDRPDPFQRRAREGGPIAPGTYRAIATDVQGVHDFADLESAQRYADDIASEADYEDIPPTAYIYDSRFERVDEGMNFARRAALRRAAASPSVPASPPSVAARIRARVRSLFVRQ